MRGSRLVLSVREKFGRAFTFGGRGLGHGRLDIDGSLYFRAGFGTLRLVKGCSISVSTHT